ncbi:flavin reductase ActVB [Mycobacterium sp. MAA66]|uniref:flavin reductase family protein n=1 Tax=Mycobacterium sp. MAA66 TaxID=3156297 RepID=UPI0035124C2D
MSGTVSNFREAMAAFPSGVTIVTTTDSDGRWWGFTATAFCSVSTEPPLVLSCLAGTAECHPVFAVADAWAVHVLRQDHAELALQFATRGVDKFAGGQFRESAQGMPILDGASVVLECAAHARLDGGDHTILVGQVVAAHVSPDPPTVYYQREFHDLATLRAETH